MAEHAHIKRARDQLIIINLLDEQAADVKQSLFPGIRHKTLQELRIVLRKVYAASIKGYPITVSDIARRSGYPRATVTRRLAMLMRMGHVERHDHTYLLCENHANAVHHQAFVDRSVQRILKACRDLSAK